MRLRSKLPVIVIAALIVIIAGVLIFISLGNKDVSFSGGAGDGTITIDGEKYEERPNLDKYLIFGVDQYSSESSDSQTEGQSGSQSSGQTQSQAGDESGDQTEDQSSETDDGQSSGQSSGQSANQQTQLPGQCDVVLLLVVNRTDDTYGIINISRNTQAQIFSYDEEGKAIDSMAAQLAYAHIHGSTEEQQAISVADSVSDLLYGTKIYKYAALDMDSIGVLNNLAGGVTVTVEEDMTNADPALRAGAEVTLTDDQAEAFVRGRMGIGKGSNWERMDRQEQFLLGVKASFMDQYQADPGWTDEALAALEECMFTNMDGNDFSKLAKAMMENEDLGMYTIQGEDTLDEDGINLLIPSKASLNEAVQALIYRPAE